MDLKPYSGSDKYIFLSYAHKDNESVHEFAERLQERGYNVWFDEGIDPGTEWDENIADHIERCSYFIAYITSNYIESQNCRDEINYARDLDKERLLIYGEDVELPKGMKMRMNRLQAIYRHKYRNNEDFYSKVFRAQGIDTCRKVVNEAPAYSAVTSWAAAPELGAAALYHDPAATLQMPQMQTAPQIMQDPALQAVQTADQKPEQKSGKKLWVPFLIIGLSALVVVGFIMLLNASHPTLEKICKSDPEVAALLQSDDPNLTIDVKNNDLYYYYNFDELGEAMQNENIDVYFESTFKLNDDDMMQNIVEIEDGTGLTNVRVILVAYYENQVVYRRIWTRNGAE